MREEEYSCVDAKLGELAPLHVLGELAGQDKRLFEDHLEACAACEEHVGALHELVRAADSLRGARSGVPPSEALAAMRSARRLSLLSGAALVAATIALVVAAGGWWRAASDVAVLGQVHSLQTRLVNLEQRNEALQQALAAGPSDDTPRPQGVSAHPFVFPPNL